MPYTAAATSKPEPTLPWAAQWEAWERLCRIERPDSVFMEKEEEGR